MFDLPVKTRRERQEATAFRNLLLDEGFMLVQYSVYVRYTPTVAISQQAITTIRRNLPQGGEVRIFRISDRQWSTAFRFSCRRQIPTDDTPLQLTIFD